MEKNIYIETIKYAEKQLKEKTPTYAHDLDNFLTSKGYTIHSGGFLTALFLEVFGTQQMRNGGFSNDPGYLNSDAYFKLLEHEELQHARKSSAQAQRNATKAIVLSKQALIVSASLAAVSIVLSLFSFFYTPVVEIDTKSIEKLGETISTTDILQE